MSFFYEIYLLIYWRWDKYAEVPFILGNSMFKINILL